MVARCLEGRNFYQPQLGIGGQKAGIHVFAGSVNHLIPFQIRCIVFTGHRADESLIKSDHGIVHNLSVAQMRLSPYNGNGPLLGRCRHRILPLRQQGCQHQ